MEKQIRVAAGAVISDSRGRFLFLQRSPQSSWGALTWQMPGGQIDWGETPEEALKREVLEETSLKVKSSKLLGTMTSRIKANGTDRHIVGLLYSVKVRGNKIKLSQEHSAYAWWTPEEAIKQDLHEHVRDVLDDFYFGKK